MKNLDDLSFKAVLKEFGITRDMFINNIDVLRGKKTHVNEQWPGEVILLIDAINNFLDTYKNELTKKTYRSTLERLNAYVSQELGKENTFVTKITPHLIEGYLGNIKPVKIGKKGYSDSTFNKSRGIILTLFNSLVKGNIIRRSPVSEVGKQTVGTPKVRSLDKEQQKRILNKAIKGREQKYRNFIFLFIMLNSGLRLIEMIRLNIGNIDIKNNAIIVERGKNNKYREVYVRPEVIQVVIDYIKSERKARFIRENKEPLFLNSKGDNAYQRFSYYAAETMVTTILRACGIIEGGCHVLRHSFSLNCLDNNLNLAEIQALLGHASIATTGIYTKVSAERIKKKINELPISDLSIENILDFDDSSLNPKIRRIRKDD